MRAIGYFMAPCGGPANTAVRRLWIRADMLLLSPICKAHFLKYLNKNSQAYAAYNLGCVC